MSHFPPIAARSVAAAAVYAAAVAACAAQATAATLSPVVTLAPERGWLSALAASADDSLHLGYVSDNAASAVVQTVTPQDALLPAVALWEGAPTDNVRGPVLTPGGATVIVNRGSAGSRATYARTLSPSGGVTEQRIGPASGRFGAGGVAAGAGSIAIDGYQQVGRRSRALLMYRAAGESRFSRPIRLPGSAHDSYTFTFAGDGTAVVNTQSEFVEPMTFRRIARDGTVGRAMRFGAIGTEAVDVAAAFLPNGDLAVAELEEVKRGAEAGRVGLFVARLQAGATRFSRPRRVASFTSTPFQLSLAVAPSGHVTLAVPTERQLIVFEGAATSLKRTHVFRTQRPSLGQVLATKGGVVIMWSALERPRSRTGVLNVSEHQVGGPWPEPTLVARGTATGDDPGVMLMGAAALAGGGAALAYRLDGPSTRYELRRAQP